MVREGLASSPERSWGNLKLCRLTKLRVRRVGNRGAGEPGNCLLRRKRSKYWHASVCHRSAIGSCRLPARIGAPQILRSLTLPEDGPGTDEPLSQRSVGPELVSGGVHRAPCDHGRLECFSLLGRVATHRIFANEWPWGTTPSLSCWCGTESKAEGMTTSVDHVNGPGLDTARLTYRATHGIGR
jgi:hypothetical protein